ncbi:protein yellow-like [Cloeon dipterum]|uniref:protein yellow-like n=1 Tax=Cloeon dipterum TaxID=197152 RepID=UPI0032200F6B
MTPFFVAIFLLGLSSLASAVNFTQVFEWPDGFDYEWPSEERKAQALENVTFNPRHISPSYLAVYGERIFLSLYKNDDGIPATLVTLPKSGASSASPKLNPFPSWDMYLNESAANCSIIDWAQGLQVDSVGRLWVLNIGSENCDGKLWIFDLNNNNEIVLIHSFSFDGWMHDLVLDETPNGTFAYISQSGERRIAVFSLERNESWLVDTEIKVFSITLSPKQQEPRQLYLGKYDSTELYSLSVTPLRNGTDYVDPELFGTWSASPYRMQVDNQGTLYAGLTWQHYISSLNSTQPSEEQRIYEVEKSGLLRSFTFSLDQNGTFWMFVFDHLGRPRYRLLNAAVGARSFGGTPECSGSCHKNDAA